MKLTIRLILFCAFFILFSNLSTSSYAVYDPTSIPNNIVGIHILFPNELADASKLVNSTGGDWGYVTIPIQASDKDLTKWQAFMDDCRKFHLIPIIRLATNGDYFNTKVWSKPSDSDVLDFANFLNALNWPTKNRYIVVFNEPNRGDEWGGTPNAAEYAETLNYATDVFKQRSDEFFIISAGLDNASINLFGQSINEYTFIREMSYEVPDIFLKIDGFASHSYPNPGFSQPPSLLGNGISSFITEQNLIRNISGKVLPVFITETGWTSDKISDSTQAGYYDYAFSSIWNDKNIVTVTPFLLRAGTGPFEQFSFITKSAAESEKYSAVKNMKKIKGEPELNNYPLNVKEGDKNQNFPIDTFLLSKSANYTERVAKATKIFMKWLLNF